MAKKPESKVVDAAMEEELGVTAPSTTDLAMLSKQITDAAALQKTIEDLEEMVKVNKQELHHITTRVIPDTMRAAGTSSFKTDTGLKVELKDFINGSLPKEADKRSRAMEWLEANGARDLIKTFFGIGLGRGQKQQAKLLEKSLLKLGVVYTQKEDVHAQTLYAYVRERMANAQPCPLELLGLYSGTVAKIELPQKVMR